jgi:hypothetical protein
VSDPKLTLTPPPLLVWENREDWSRIFDSGANHYLQPLYCLGASEVYRPGLSPTHPEMSCTEGFFPYFFGSATAVSFSKKDHYVPFDEGKFNALKVSTFFIGGLWNGEPPPLYPNGLLKKKLTTPAILPPPLELPQCEDLPEPIRDKGYPCIDGSSAAQPGDLSKLTRPIDNILNPTPMKEQVIDLLVQLTNNVYSADIDLYHAPYNRWSGAHRYSEYHPIEGRPEKTTVEIKDKTVARIHGEIRPVRGRNYSIINRWSIDFQPNVLYKPSSLEIDGFAGVDVPNGMQYDQSFKGKYAVKKLPNYDYSYENPLGSTGPLTTPWAAPVDPPPSGRKDWMIRFQPVEDSLAASFKTAVADGGPFAFVQRESVGQILLWALLPTLGLHDSEIYKKLGVRYLNFPRRPGDLVKLFEPYFYGDWKEHLKHKAPYLNPNSEYYERYYIDEQGKAVEFLTLDNNGNKKELLKNYCEIKAVNVDQEERCEQGNYTPAQKAVLNSVAEQIEAKCGRLPKPEDAKTCLPPAGRRRIPDGRYADYEICEINQWKKYFREPEIENHNRSGVVDWIFTDIVKPQQLSQLLAMIRAGQTPSAKAHIQMRPGTIRTPSIQFKTDASTHIYVAHYGVRRVNESEAHLGAKIHVSNLKLENVNFQLGQFGVSATQLHAQKVFIDAPSIPGLDSADPKNRPPITVTLKGVKATGFSFFDVQEGWSMVMDQASLGDLKLTYLPSEQTWSIHLSNLQGSALKMKNPQLGEMSVTAGFKIPKLEWSRTLQEVVVENGLKNEEEIRQCYIKGKLIQAADQNLPATKLVTQFLSVKISELQTQGTVELKGNKDLPLNLTLSGASVLKNISFSKQAQGDGDVYKGGLGFSGTIDAQIQTPKLCETEATMEEMKADDCKVSFTTREVREDGSETHPISGDLVFSVHTSKKDEKAQRDYTFNMDLPFVGFASKGLLEIPEREGQAFEGSTLKGGKIHLKADSREHEGTLTGSMEGKLQLLNATVDTSLKKLEWGEIRVAPKLSNINLTAAFKFDILADGFRLQPAAGAVDPLSLAFNLAGGISYTSNSSRSDLNIERADVAISDLKVLEVQKNKLSRLQSGAITAHHLRGAATFQFPPSLLTGFKKVNVGFPEFGGNYRLDSRLVEHLDPDARKAFEALVGTEDFIHAEKIDYSVSNGNLQGDFENIIVNLHEAGGRGQYLLFREPKVHIDTAQGRNPDWRWPINCIKVYTGMPWSPFLRSNLPATKACHMVPVSPGPAPAPKEKEN